MRARPSRHSDAGSWHWRALGYVGQRALELTRALFSTATGMLHEAIWGGVSHALENVRNDVRSASPDVLGHADPGILDLVVSGFAP